MSGTQMPATLPPQLLMMLAQQAGMQPNAQGPMGNGLPPGSYGQQGRGPMAPRLTMGVPGQMSRPGLTPAPMASQQPGVPGSMGGTMMPSVNPATGMQQFNLQDGNPNTPPAAAAPPIPPQVLAMLMARMQQGGMGAPPGAGGMPPGGMPPQMPPGGGGMPPGMMGPRPPMMPPMQGGPPPGAMPGQPPPQMQGPMGGPNQPNPGQTGQPSGQPMPPPGQRPMTPAQMAAQGRNGDAIVAHLSPGEISIPPQVQTPQLMEAIRQAFARFGINPAQFTAGSPASSQNPNTGAPEYDLFSSLLPILGAAGATIGAPYLAAAAPALASSLGAAYIPALAGLGGAAGSAAGGGNVAQALTSGVGAAGGSAMMGGLGAAASGANSATLANAPYMSVAGANNPFGGNTMDAALGKAPFDPFAGNTMGVGAAGASGAAGAPSAATASTLGGLRPAVGAGLGAGLGQALTPATQKSVLPPGFNSNLPPLNPNFGQLNGSGVQNTPTFQNYNPYQAVSGPNPGFSFYPT